MEAIILEDMPNLANLTRGDRVAVHGKAESGLWKVVKVENNSYPSTLWYVENHHLIFINPQKPELTLLTLKTLIKLRNHVKSRSNTEHGQPL